MNCNGRDGNAYHTASFARRAQDERTRLGSETGVKLRDWQWAVDSGMRRRVIWGKRRRMNWRRQYANIENENERTLKGELVSGGRGTIIL